MASCRNHLLKMIPSISSITSWIPMLVLFSVLQDLKGLSACQVDNFNVMNVRGALWCLGRFCTASTEAERPSIINQTKTKRQRAATHTAAEAEASTEKARAEEGAAAAADAEAAGEAAWPGPKCSKYHEPTKGHTTGRPGPQCTALPSPERARGSFHTAVEVEEAH